MTPSLPFGIGVLDANGIIGLAKSGCFSSLPHLFDALFVPTAVVREVTDPISRPELNAALAAWLSEANPGTAALQQIPMLRREADRSVLALALDLQPCIVVTSDRGMVNLAKRLLISTISAPRIIEFLARDGLIAAAKPYLDQMIRHGFGIPHELYVAILQRLGE